MSAWKEFSKGILRENPIFVIVLGLCPTLAVTTQTINGVGMGLAVIFVLTMSNLLISLLRNFIPEVVRIPSYIVIIASFVTIVQMVIRAFAPELDRALGIFIPLI
ncbi:MAG: Rnf-Nqr domain containing protein, partial [Brevinematales bacterium]